MESRGNSVGNNSTNFAGTAGTGRERHPYLYLEHEEGTVILLAEQTLFKVHEYFLKQHSIIFASMFTLNPGATPEEGRSDELPIPLPAVSAVDLARFLLLFYPRDVVSGDLSTLDEWTSVLRLAHRYEFEQHRTLAIERLERLATPIDRILLARMYDITHWLQEAYYDLCVREEALTYDEGVRLGMADVILLADLRQRIRGPVMRSHMHEQYIRSTIRSKLHALSPA
ncbi:hypothetical protein BV20DRAFT_968647 [Pilatotrama ljubarskyi]|nr:hypothetical protein BV20DRAFT_968647 [Pilatotrama ljubarskyi]